MQTATTGAHLQYSGSTNYEALSCPLISFDTNCRTLVLTGGEGLWRLHCVQLLTRPSCVLVLWALEFPSPFDDFLLQFDCFINPSLSVY